MREQTSLLFQRNMRQIGVKVALGYVEDAVLFEPPRPVPSTVAGTTWPSSRGWPASQPPVSLFTCDRIPTEANEWSGRTRRMVRARVRPAGRAGRAAVDRDEASRAVAGAGGLRRGVAGDAVVRAREGHGHRPAPFSTSARTCRDQRDLEHRDLGLRQSSRCPRPAASARRRSGGAFGQTTTHWQAGHGTLLDIRGLKTYFFTEDGVVKAVDGVDLTVARGETLGLVGESGCGKSVAMFSVLRLISQPGRIVDGEIFFDGRDLCALSESDMHDIRGNRISMIFQQPLSSLNPVFRVGDQIARGVRDPRRGVAGTRRVRGRSRCSHMVGHPRRRAPRAVVSRTRSRAGRRSAS